MCLTRPLRPYELSSRMTGRLSRAKDRAVLGSLHCIRYATTLIGETQLTIRPCVNFALGHHKLSGKDGIIRSTSIALEVGIIDLIFAWDFSERILFKFRSLVVVLMCHSGTSFS